MLILYMKSDVLYNLEDKDDVLMIETANWFLKNPTNCVASHALSFDSFVNSN